jgi:cbb3-type cytochrome oxidase maturation protein
MDIVFVLLPITLIIVLAALVAFIWAVRRGQFDDLKTPAIRMLFEEQDSSDIPENNNSN